MSYVRIFGAEEGAVGRFTFGLVGLKFYASCRIRGRWFRITF